MNVDQWKIPIIQETNMCTSNSKTLTTHCVCDGLMANLFNNIAISVFVNDHEKKKATKPNSVSVFLEKQTIVKTLKCTHDHWHS